MSKLFKVLLATLVILFLMAFSFFAGFEVARVPLGYTNPFTPPTKLPAKFTTLDEVWHILSQDFVQKDKLNPEKLGDGAIKGMLEALDDPYTSYLSAQDYKLQLSSFEGKFDGIGATVDIKDKQLMVVAPIPDSPAERSGIKAGDKILAVDGESTAKMTLAQAVLKIRGKAGTKVKLLILHQGETKPVEIEIVRAEIKLKSVQYKMLSDNIGYIRITHFSALTDQELIPALETLRNQGVRGLVLDLRDNPGGILPVVVNVASQFLNGGVVLYERHSDGSIKTWEAKSGGLATNLPLAVLVNNHSASGSEVLAGALQDRGRALIAGTKTFGKGSVNSLRPLSDNSGLYLTIARWLTPNERLIEGNGLEPSYVIELKGDDLVNWAVNYLKSKRVADMPKAVLVAAEAR